MAQDRIRTSITSQERNRLIRNLIREESSAVATEIAMPVLKEMQRQSFGSVINVNPISGSLSFASNSLAHLSGYAGRRSITGFTWGVDTWGDGRVSPENDPASTSTTQSGVDSSYLATGDRGGVHRRF